MKTSPLSRLMSLALAAGVTLSVLMGIDALATPNAASAPSMAIGNTQRGA